jgi:tetratricopeptide (TPR) repeat protein
LDALDRNGRGGTVGRVTITINRASVLLRLGEVTRAEAAIVDALNRAQRLSEGKPADARYVVSHAIILNRLGKSDEAIKRLEAAGRELRAAGNTTWVLNADYHLARALMLSGKHEQSLQLLGEIRDVWSKNATANKDRLADLSRTLAEIELEHGQLKEAKEQIDESLKLFGYPSAQPALNLTAALTTAARIYSALQQHQEAEAFARAALKISEGIARERAQSADVGEALLALASVHQAKGDGAAAKDAATQAVEALSNGLGQSHPLTRQAVSL